MVSRRDADLASWLRWRYHYPQAEFPYERLRQENASRTREQTGIRASRHWRV